MISLVSESFEIISPVKDFFNPSGFIKTKTFSSMIFYLENSLKRFVLIAIMLLSKVIYFLIMKISLEKIFTNFKFDWFFISVPNLNFLVKLRFFWNKYLAILLNKRRINYLGGCFFYDNRFAPAILEIYPKEIYELNKKINFKNLKNVLDIGANIGQFTYTLERFYPHLNIYSFEPNKEVYPLLEKNVANFKNVKTYNFALGEKNGEKNFYFSPDASVEGSFYKENASQNPYHLDIKKISVNVLNFNPQNIVALKLLKNYDLIKIDVEGAEVEVLKSLKGVKTKYLAVEISGKKNLGEVKLLIDKFWGDADLIDYNLLNKKLSVVSKVFRIK